MKKMKKIPKNMDRDRRLNRILRKGRKVENKQRPVEFPKGEPDYWYGEYDIEAKMLEVRLGKFIVRIPQETVLFWFMHTEYNSRLRDENTDEVP